MSKVLDKLRPLYQASKVMKAIRVHKFGGPEALQLDSDVPVPKPSTSQVLIRTKAVGVNPVETYIRSGQYARLPTLPFIPGSDCAGIVEEVGGEVKNVKKGDRVFTARAMTGSYAEYTVALASTVQPLPNALSFTQGASLAVPYLTAYRALFQRVHAKPGETVLVHGASGGVGTAAVQFARAHGMKVVGTAGTPEGIELVKKAGAHFAFNHRDPAHFADMRKAIDGQGFDVVIENASHINLGIDLAMLANGGRVAVVGSRGPIEINPRDTMSREASITGVMLAVASEEDLKESYAAIQAGIEAGWLQPIVGKEFPLEKAGEAHKDIMAGSGALGKTVLVVK